MGIKDTWNSIVGFFTNKSKGMHSKVVNALDVYNYFFSNSKDPEFNSTFMSAVNAHARHFSKIRPRAYFDGEISKTRNKLNYLLTLRPNKLMSASQLYEIVANDYFTYNIAVLYLEWDYMNYKEPLKAIWPIKMDDSSTVFRIDKDTDEPYLKFRIDGSERVTKLDDLIMLTRNADSKNIFGRKSKPIEQAIKTIQTNYEGIEQAIKMSGFIRFILQTATVLNEDAKKARAEEFSKNWLQDNKLGVIYADGTASIQPVDSSKGRYAEPEHIKDMKSEIYDYLGINEKIINNTFSELEWQAYYEGSLEPLIIKLEDELMYKIFTNKELSAGNKISVMIDRLQTASLATRNAIADRYLKLPIIVPNVICDLLLLPHMEGGDKPMASLNFVQANKQNEYQDVGNDDSDDKEDEDDGSKDKETEQ